MKEYGNFVLKVKQTAEDAGLDCTIIVINNKKKDPSHEKCMKDSFTLKDIRLHIARQMIKYHNDDIEIISYSGPWKYYAMNVPSGLIDDETGNLYHQFLIYRREDNKSDGEPITVCEFKFNMNDTVEILSGSSRRNHRSSNSYDDSYPLDGPQLQCKETNEFIDFIRAMIGELRRTM